MQLPRYSFWIDAFPKILGMAVEEFHAFRNTADSRSGEIGDDAALTEIAAILALVSRKRRRPPLARAPVG